MTTELIFKMYESSYWGDATLIYRISFVSYLNVTEGQKTP